MTEKKKETKENPDEMGVFRFQRELAEANASVIDSARLAAWAHPHPHEAESEPA